MNIDTDAIIRAIAETPPNFAIRPPLPKPDMKVVGMNADLPATLTTVHIGWLTKAIIDAAATAVAHGGELQFFLADESRGLIVRFRQLALGAGCILRLYAAGSEAEIGVHTVECAERDWPYVEGLFDLDGAPCEGVTLDCLRLALRSAA
jgi:hypothetical protein